MGWFAFGKYALLSGTLLIREGQSLQDQHGPDIRTSNMEAIRKHSKYKGNQVDASSPCDDRVLPEGAQPPPPALWTPQLGPG